MTWRPRVVGFTVSRQVDGDREIILKGENLIQEKLMVCGVNPELNGFTGASCRLYPQKEDEGSESSEEVNEEEVLKLVEWTGPMFEA